jgi:hypothetical protein
MQALNQLVFNKFLGAQYAPDLSLAEMQTQQGSLRFSYQREVSTAQSAGILLRSIVQDAIAPGTSFQVVQALDLPSLQISESKVTPNFHPPEFCGRSVENRNRIFGKGSLLTTTAKGYQIWQTELKSFDGKSAHFGIKVIVVKVGDTLLVLDLQNAATKPSIEEWTRVVDSLKEVNLTELDHARKHNP